MPMDDRRLAQLIEALEATGRRYVALGFADAFKAANTVEGSTAGEREQTARAKSDWEAADRALSDYRKSHH